MDVYRTEEEQIEQIKRFWRDYGRSIMFGLLACIAIVFGWRYWQNAKQTQALNASAAFEQLLSTAVNEPKTDLTTQANNIIQHYASTPYAALASLVLAKQEIEHKDYITAKKHLQWAMNNAKAAPVKQIARIRAARLSIAQNKPQLAIELLQKLTDATFSPYVANVRGDALLAMGKKDLARDAFQVALNSLPQQSNIRPLIQMKLDDLAPLSSIAGQTEQKHT